MGGVPSQIFTLPVLFLGGRDVLDNPEFFKKNGLQYVLSLGPDVPHQRIPLVRREHINVGDVPTADLSRHFRKAVLFIAEGRHVAKCGVYVHCAAGISRSTTCLCAYLMVHLSLTFNEALAFLASRRRAVCPNDGFSKQLKQFAQSNDRVLLAEELAQQCEGYAELQQRDLEEVRRSLHVPERRHEPRSMYRASSCGTSRSRPSSLSQVEKLQQQQALRCVRDALSTQDASGGHPGVPLRIGRGESEGDAGLGWLMKQPPAGREPAYMPAAGRSTGGSSRRGSSHSTAMGGVPGATSGGLPRDLGYNYREALGRRSDIGGLRGRH